MRSMLVAAWFAAVSTAGAQVVPGEILRNPGLNEDADGNGLPDHWTTSHDRVRWREKVFMGKDYEVLSQPGQYVLATQDISLKKGQRYTVTLKCRGEGGGLAGALIVHGATRPTREMPLIWRVEPSSEYEEIVRTFVAPNPVARLYIYNVAKTKGTVYYDYVSLREGGPDRAIITQLSLREIDRPLTDPIERRHIDWASPLAGGPVRTFITLRNFRCLRQVTELTQRIDLDCDVVHTGYTGEEAVSVTGRRAMRRMKDGFYDVYVVASRITDIMAKSIRERVEEGAGLFVVSGFGRASRFVDVKGLRGVGDDHYLRNGFPWDLMPEKILESVQVGKLGKGRVVRMVFPMDTSRVWGLMPTENSREAWKARQFEYWEWWESLLAKGITWASGREGEIRIQTDSPEAGALRLRAAPSTTFDVQFRSAREIRFDGPLLRLPSRQTPASDDGSVTLRAPAKLPAGQTIADVRLLNAAGQVLTWGSYVLTKPQAVQIEELSVERSVLRPGATVALTATLNVERSCAATVEAKLIDAFGRVISVTESKQALSAGERELALRPVLRRPLCVHHKAFVRAVVNGVEQDSRWLAVLVPEVGPRRALEDFLAMPWGPGMSHPLIEAYYAERTQELGLNGMFARNPYLTGEQGLPGGVYVGGLGEYRETKFSESGVRSKCLSDPAIVKRIAERTRESALALKDYGMFAVGITDEAFLTSRHKRHEVCFSHHCQARYRKWLKERYQTLAALNGVWDTEHESWDEIGGVRTEDVRGKANFAPFVDFRTFMTDVWVDACKTVVDAYHEIDPSMPIGHTNTFGANPFNGNDYWKLCTQTGFAWGQEYSEAIKGTGHKAIFDLWRSFVETKPARAARPTAAPFFNHGWIGYDHRVAAAHYEPWWLALHGSRGVSYFATNAIAPGRGTSWALVYPTLSFTEYSLAVKEALADLRGGCGRVLMEYERERPKVAILWSHPSMLVAWCESSHEEPVPNERGATDSYGSYFRSALHFRQHLNELQLDYAYVAPEQILTSDVLGQYPLVILPFTIAASEELIDRLAAYVEAGGVLVGDLRCLRTDEHGKPFADSAHLERLFGVSRGSGPVDYGATKVAFVEAAEDIQLTGRAVELYGRESVTPAGAAALGSHATGEPAVLVRRYGKGLSVYLNFALPAYDVLTRDLIGQITRRAGIGRAVIAENPAGTDPPRGYERNTFTRGPISVHAFIRDHRRCTDTDPVRFRFGKASHVYDVRGKTYLGQVDTVDAMVAPGHTALYACLPYQVKEVSVSVPAEARVGDEVSIEARILAGDSKVGDHVLHVELISPRQTAVRHYTRNVLAENGVLGTRLPMALNERVGQWTVCVRDVLTGVAGRAPITLTQR